MGTYLNPGNEGFARIVRGGYVDKTEMIGRLNSTIDGPAFLTCISRPRRFGKSYAAQMLAAYYDKTVDSHALFDGLAISKDSSYEEHINKYDVIYLDMAGIIGDAGSADAILPYIKRNVASEVREAVTGAGVEEGLAAVLAGLVGRTGNKIVMIIDEWDAPIRENPKGEREYLEFLRSLFKNGSVTPKAFAAVYMTGILPIRKDGSQSAISDFEEFTMLKPRQFAKYVGFTEKEVMSLCERHGADFSMMKKWYDGYLAKGAGSIYNPNSVMKAIRYGEFDSYWTETSAASGLMDYISKGYAGLSKTVAELVGGVDVPVDANGFANDLVTFRGRDDVLTLLIHLGYLTYDQDAGTAHIPNEEVRQEFARAIRTVDHEETMKRVAESDALFLDTIAGNEGAVAARIEKIHAEETAPLHYNREEDLRSVIKLAYYAYRDNYVQFEELPAGEGYADIVYLPKRGSGWPALVVELKWNKSAEGAISQIKKMHYPESLRGFSEEIVLVGINYDKDAPAGKRKHECKIERLQL